MLECVTIGNYATNCYILIDDATKEALAVDCAVFTPAYRQTIADLGITKLRYILLTHGHFDHICGVKALKDAFGGEICIHADDAACLYDEDQSVNSQVEFAPQGLCEADILLQEGSRLPFGTGEITVMHTPGHTRGSVCFLYEDMMFSGDTLFYLSMGRTDLPGGSTRQLFASLRRIGQMEGEYRILPGHGEETLLSFEKQYNRYLRAK